MYFQALPYIHSNELMGPEPQHVGIELPKNLAVN